jgi:prevent-host-death family protein
MQTWQAQTAKARFSELIALSKQEPQLITIRGEESAVVISKELYEQLVKPKPDLYSFLQSSPLADSEIEFEADRDKTSSMRNIGEL